MSAPLIDSEFLAQAFPDPWKRMTWSLGALTAVTRGATESTRRLAEALSDEEEE